MTVKSHFITIDTSVLYGIVKDAGLISEECNRDTFVSMGHSQWLSLFNINRIQVKNQTFTRTMETDGICSNFHFTRPKNQFFFQLLYDTFYVL